MELHAHVVSQNLTSEYYADDTESEMHPGMTEKECSTWLRQDVQLNKIVFLKYDFILLWMSLLKYL